MRRNLIITLKTAPVDCSEKGLEEVEVSRRRRWGGRALSFCSRSEAGCQEARTAGLRELAAVCVIELSTVIFLLMQGLAGPCPPESVNKLRNACGALPRWRLRMLDCIQNSTLGRLAVAGEVCPWIVVTIQCENLHRSKEMSPKGDGVVLARSFTGKRHF